jgi:hypothetical protein
VAAKADWNQVQRITKELDSKINDVMAYMVAKGQEKAVIVARRNWACLSCGRPL